MAAVKECWWADAASEATAAADGVVGATGTALPAAAAARARPQVEPACTADVMHVFEVL